MTDAEQRRRDLLEQTRTMYQDRNKIPAVHPRYGSTYEKLYGGNEDSGSGSSLKIRTLLAVALFVIFAGADYTGTQIGNYECDEIVEAVSYNIDIVNQANSW